jgi:hypothetical protein
MAPPRTETTGRLLQKRNTPVKNFLRLTCCIFDDRRAVADIVRYRRKAADRKEKTLKIGAMLGA